MSKKATSNHTTTSSAGGAESGASPERAVGTETGGGGTFSGGFGALAWGERTWHTTASPRNVGRTTEVMGMDAKEQLGGLTITDEGWRNPGPRGQAGDPTDDDGCPRSEWIMEPLGPRRWAYGWWELAPCLWTPGRTDNAVVERSHGVLADWVEPPLSGFCALSGATGWAPIAARTLPGGEWRLQSHPTLLRNERAYDSVWSMLRVNLSEPVCLPAQGRKLDR